MHWYLVPELESATTLLSCHTAAGLQTSCIFLLSCSSCVYIIFSVIIKYSDSVSHSYTLCRNGHLEAINVAIADFNCDSTFVTFGWTASSIRNKIKKWNIQRTKNKILKCSIPEHSNIHDSLCTSCGEHCVMHKYAKICSCSCIYFKNLLCRAKIAMCTP